MPGLEELAIAAEFADVEALVSTTDVFVSLTWVVLSDVLTTAPVTVDLETEPPVCVWTVPELEVSVSPSLDFVTEAVLSEFLEAAELEGITNILSDWIPVETLPEVSVMPELVVSATPLVWVLVAEELTPPPVEVLTILVFDVSTAVFFGVSETSMFDFVTTDSVPEVTIGIVSEPFWLGLASLVAVISPVTLPLLVFEFKLSDKSPPLKTPVVWTLATAVETEEPSVVLTSTSLLVSLVSYLLEEEPFEIVLLWVLDKWVPLSVDSEAECEDCNSVPLNPVGVEAPPKLESWVVVVPSSAIVVVSKIEVPIWLEPLVTVSPPSIEVECLASSDCEPLKLVLISLWVLSVCPVLPDVLVASVAVSSLVVEPTLLWWDVDDPPVAPVSWLICWDKEGWGAAVELIACNSVLSDALGDVT